MADDASNLAASLEAELNQMAESDPVQASGPKAVANDGGGKHDWEQDEKKDRNLSLILDIPLRVTVELGRTKMVVTDLLNLGQGSVIELSKLAGEPMEVLVNDKLVARGEAVVVNEKFGVRLTDIISPTERVEQLK